MNFPLFIMKAFVHNLLIRFKDFELVHYFNLLSLTGIQFLLIIKKLWIDNNFLNVLFFHFSERYHTDTFNILISLFHNPESSY